MDLFYHTLIPLATQRFKGKVDRGKTPYIEHCLAVANRLEGFDNKILGLLHDILEDTETTREELSRMGVPSDILDDLDLLTKLPGESRSHNAVRISKSRRATMVKIADVTENTDLRRLKVVRAADIERTNEYLKILSFFRSCHPDLF